MSTPPDDLGRLPSASPFPDGFGFYDRPPKMYPDPTVAPPPQVTPAPAPAPPPPPPPEPPTPYAQPRARPPEPPPSGTGVRVGPVLWVVLALCAVGIVPALWNAWDPFSSEPTEDGDIGGFEEIGGSTEPLRADELYSDQSYPFRIELSDRVMEGELNLIEAFDHPHCPSAAVDEAAAQALSGCRSRIEAAYTGADEGLRISQQILMFEDVLSAEGFYRLLEDEFAGEVLTFEDPGDIEGSEYAASRAGVEGQYVVVTLMVSDSGAEADVTAAEEHAHARHAESLSYLIWR